ncbi:Aste57867_1197 [Aphanomyces stellatus]|uniref:HECT-type E3 ubiquitin transferase n=1 Tax=Aphanomyces stellatus TaxID=120398 RepID=A0A485K8T0_9STRA|nr:hypothetical protein As57867_001196 [Aphanomyces stellatus]VFT78417.1 Aste57867_1197 [Aphanomyces stellatus]
MQQELRHSKEFYAAIAVASVLLVIVIVCIVWMSMCRTYRGRGRPFGDLDFGTTTRQEVLLRENLEDSFLEEGRIEWQCVVCAHMNHPDKTACSLCGATEGTFPSIHLVLMAHTNTTTMLKCTSTSLSKSFMIQACLDGFVEEDGHVTGSSRRLSLAEARQRALVYRRNNSQLTQRQRQAKRRRLWQRAQLHTGEYVWVRTATFVNSNGNRDDTFLLSLAHDPKRDSLDEMLHRKNAVSFGFVTKHNKDTGELMWSRASLRGRSHLQEIDELQCVDVDGDFDVEGMMALAFKEKKTWFVKKIKQLAVPRFDALFAIRTSDTLDSSWRDRPHELGVRRQFIFEDSVKLLRHATDTGRTREYLHISFEGEEGLDAGGILREWYLLVCNEVFSAALGLFCTTHAENQSYWINPASALMMGPRHLEYYRFVGHLLGRGILEGLVLDAYLSLPLLKHILGVPISFSDLEFLDQDLYKSCVYVRDHDGADALCLTFSIQSPLTGEEVDLKPNGRHIDVTDANKLEYLALVLEYKMLGSIAPQLKELLLGLYEVIPRAMLSVFDYQELEFFICGLPNISLDDWRKNTTVRYMRDKDPAPQKQVIEWFWQVVQSFDDEERGRLLQFSTGCSRLPVEGFKGLTSSSGQIYKFSIQMVDRAPPPAGMCPKAHTCFNRIDLPLYADLDELQNYLSLVIQMEITGFGME